MVDGEVFKRTIVCETSRLAFDIVRIGLESTCFSLGQCPDTILVSANVRNVDIVEKL